jgi:hypothetical protein
VPRFAPSLIAILAAASLLACASANAPTKSRSVLAGNAARNVLILPLNTTSIQSPELAELSDLVWSEIETYLRAGSRQLQSASMRDARSLWLSSIKQARSGANNARAGFDEAAPLLARELAKHADFDALIIPSLFVREAPISGKAASWDGVERLLEFERNGRSTEGLYVDDEYVGNAPAASLHVVILDADGVELQESVGGLELLIRVRAKKVLGPAKRPVLEFAPYTGPFTNAEHIREGITEALAPLFLPPLPSPPE